MEDPAHSVDRLGRRSILCAVTDAGAADLFDGGRHPTEAAHPLTHHNHKRTITV